MPRTKSFSSTLTKICELATQITILLNGAQDEYDKLAADSAQLKVIEPALKRLRVYLKPEIANQITTFEPPSVSSEEAPAGPTNEPSAEPNSKQPKRHRANRGVANNESDIPRS